MSNNVDMRLLIGRLAMLACGIAFLVAAMLVGRQNVTAKKWFGSSVRLLILAGIFGTVAGLLNIGRLIVPASFAETYASFFLVSMILLIAVLIGAALYGRRIG
jgi:hypothetical protein